MSVLNHRFETDSACIYGHRSRFFCLLRVDSSHRDKSLDSSPKGEPQHEQRVVTPARAVSGGKIPISANVTDQEIVGWEEEDAQVNRE